MDTNQFEKITLSMRLGDERNNQLRMACARGILTAFGMNVIQEFMDKYSEIDIHLEVKGNAQIKNAIIRANKFCNVVVTYHT